MEETDLTNATLTADIIPHSYHRREPISFPYRLIVDLNDRATLTRADR